MNGWRWSLCLAPSAGGERTQPLPRGWGFPVKKPGCSGVWGIPDSSTPSASGPAPGRIFPVPTLPSQRIPPGLPFPEAHSGGKARPPLLRLWLPSGHWKSRENLRIPALPVGWEGQVDHPHSEPGGKRTKFPFSKGALSQPELSLDHFPGIQEPALPPDPRKTWNGGTRDRNQSRSPGAQPRPKIDFKEEEY